MPTAMGPSTEVSQLNSWLVGVVVSMATLSTAFVVLRLVSRRMRQQKLWWDDWTILVSMCWNVISVALIFAMRARNLGGPASDLEDDRAALLKLLVATQIAYTWNKCLTKASALLMYYRTLDLWPVSRTYLFFLAGFVLAWAVTITFLSVFACVPVQKLWHSGLPGHCLNYVALWIAGAAGMVSTDLAVILFPLPHVWGLSLSLVEKISVTLLFMMGFFAVFTSAYHFSTLFASSMGDFPIAIVPAVGWTEIEVAAGIIAACLPLLGPLLPPWRSRRSAARANNGEDDAETAAVVMTLSSEGSSGDGDGDGPWRVPSSTARATTKLSADSRRTSRAASLWSNAVGGGGGGGKRGAQEHLSNLDAWDWERAVEGLTRAEELSMCQYEASAARVEDVEVPEHGINVTTDFRRWSVKEIYGKR